MSEELHLHRAEGGAQVQPHDPARLFPAPSPTAPSITSTNISLGVSSLFFSLLSPAWAGGQSNYVNSAIRMISHSMSAKKMLEIGS